MQFSLEEMDYLNSVESISILFEIQSKDINCRDYQDPNGYFKKTRFIAIKMECLKEERSINAFSVTKILNKIYPYPVFILFSHNNYIMFSSLLYKDVHNV